MIANPQELRQRGYKALVDALGPIDTIRFIQQMSEGRGDYTKDRKTWLGNPTVDEIVKKRVKGGNRTK
nr:hypothetical protein [Candidatus Sigynarchaeum springense]